MNTASDTAIFLVGFGGPTSAKEVRPFLESVTEGASIPEERLLEVEHHYEAVGGLSPYNTLTFNQKAALESLLKKKEIFSPVLVGFRHSQPTFFDVFCAMKDQKIKSAVIAVLSTFRSYASFGKYQEKLEEARRETDATSVKILYTEPFFLYPNFIEAQSLRVEEVLSKMTQAQRSKTFLMFTAHSIPKQMADECSYEQEFREASRLTSERLRTQAWGIAYQSRSGSPRQPWLEPSVEEALKGLSREQFRNVLLIPIGFLCDNVEIIYDLDIQAKNSVEGLGLSYFRAKTVMDHPVFIRLLADCIKEALQHPSWI